MVRVFAPTATSDNSTWTLVGDSDVHLCVDDPTASSDDATTYVQAAFDGATFTVDLPSISPVPSVAAGHTLRVRARNAGGAAIDVGEVVVSLLDAGGPLFASPKTEIDNAGWADFSFDLGLASPLSDYSALRIQVDDAGVNVDKRLRISSVEFEIPSEVAITGSTSASGSPSATMKGIGVLTGSSAGSASAAAACTGIGALSGSSASNAQAAALLLGVGSIAGSSSATGSLTGTGSLVTLGTGSIASTASASASAIGVASISGSISASASASAVVDDGAELGPWETLSNIVRARVDEEVATPLGLSAAYDNAPFTVPTATYLRVSVRSDAAEQITIASAHAYRKSGEAIVSILAPLGEGDGPSLTIAAAVVAAMRGVTVNQVTFEAPRIVVVQRGSIEHPGIREGSRWRTDVRMRFRADFTLDRIAGSEPTTLDLASAAAVLRSRFHEVATTLHSVTVQYDGEEQVEQDPTGLWARFTVLHGDQRAVEHVGASRLYRTVGLGSALIFVPLEAGEREALRLADQIADHFRSVSDRGVTFKTPLVSGTQRAGAWWQVVVTCPFQWDEIA